MTDESKAGAAGGATPGFAARFPNLRTGGGGPEDGSCGPETMVCDSSDGPRFVATLNPHYYGEPDARAFVAGLRALGLLRDIEWRGMNYDRREEGTYPSCPSCKGFRPGFDPAVDSPFPDADQWIGHSPDCRLAAVLRDAGGEEDDDE